MKKLIFCFLFIFPLCNIVSSQVLSPVKWEFSYKKLENNQVKLIFKGEFAKNWYIYDIKPNKEVPVIPTSVSITTTDDFSLIGSVVATPPAVEKFDNTFGAKLGTFHNKVVLTQIIKLHSSSDIKVSGYVEFMSCNNEQCLAPKQEYFDLDIASEGTVVSPAEDEPASSNKTKRSLWAFFWAAIGAGFLAIIMPCIYPMIPLTVSFFIKNEESKRGNRLKVLIFGASIILIYTTVGTVVSVLFGATFANFLSTHWLPNVLFFLIFIVFAFAFFGMFEIVLPARVTNIFASRQDSDKWIGPFFMAFTLVLVSFACTGPIVGSALVFSTQGEVVLPIIVMLGFSLPFALVFGFFAFFPSWLKGLPKSGGWLNNVKVVLGFLELALALKFLSVADQTYHWRLLDREVYISFWIVLATLLGFYLLGKLRFALDSEVKVVSVPRLMLAIVSFSFAVYMLPGMFGAPLKVLSGLLPPISTHDFDLNRIVRDNSGVQEVMLCDKPKYQDKFELPFGLNGYFDYEQALACAKEQGKPVFIDFTGHGCVNCRKMEEHVWIDARVQKRLRENFVVVALYVDDKNIMDEKDWVRSNVDGRTKKTIGGKFADLQVEKFNVNAQPYYVLLGLKEEILVKPIGMELNVEQFIEFLDTGIKKFNENYK